MVLEVKTMEDLIRKKVKKTIKNIRIMIPTTTSLAQKIAKRNSRINHKICSKPTQAMVSTRHSQLRFAKAIIQTSLQ